MNGAALQSCLGLVHAYARLRRKLDDELGTLHGLSLDDFVLLDALFRSDSAGLCAADLEGPLGVQRSAVVRQVIALEKTGLLQRMNDHGVRSIQLRSPGRRLLQEATETAEAVCAAALAANVQMGVRADDFHRALCGSLALELR
jgi:MarR family transcriptional regulator, organic hydroperoxide resistance regulator